MASRLDGDRGRDDRFRDGDRQGRHPDRSLHYNLPKGPESYAQEIGRAGRDGLLARCELFACAEDVTTLENFAFGDTPTPEAVASLVGGSDGARGAEFDLSTYDLSQAHDVRPLVVQTLLTYLELLGNRSRRQVHFMPSTSSSRTARSSEIIARFDPKRREFLFQGLRSVRREAGSGQPSTSTRRRGSMGEPRGADRGGARLPGRAGRADRTGDRLAGIGYRLLREPPSTDPPWYAQPCSGGSSTARPATSTGSARMLDFALDPACLTARLDEPISARRSTEPCGHCGPLSRPSRSPIHFL